MSFIQFLIIQFANWEDAQNLIVAIVAILKLRIISSAGEKSQVKLLWARLETRSLLVIFVIIISFILRLFRHIVWNPFTEIRIETAAKNDFVLLSPSI